MVICFICGGCGGGSDEPDTPDGTTRTIIVYMAANNNLSGYASLDLEEMKTAMKSGKTAGGRLLVYKSMPSKAPILEEITSSGVENTLIEYSAEESSLTIDRMRQVLSDATAKAPADTYGLVLWSHATGWINDSGVIEESESKARPQSFGAEGTPMQRMKLSSLAKALQGYTFSFIYFDCCHMATVEVAYELRNATPYIVASPSELPVYGMPYNTNLPILFTASDATTLSQAAANTFGQYTTDQYGCNITVINTGAIDQLASATRAILSTGATLDDDYQPVAYFRTIVMSTGIYDMYHYVHNLNGVDATLVAEWDKAFNDVVTYFRTTTPYVYQCPSADFHGLGCQIIRVASDADKYDYRDTQWWADVVSDMFN